MKLFLVVAGALLFTPIISVAAEINGETKEQCEAARAASESAPATTTLGATPIKRAPPRWPSSVSPNYKYSYICVQVAFDVNESGETENQHVVFTAPADAHDAFERVSLMAVRKWKYEPAIVDGVPARRTGVITMLTFEKF